MLFSIIIPSCNRPDLLRRCLNALHPDVQNVDPVLYEVIVTDDSDNEETLRMLQKDFSWVKWMKGPKNGIAANRNNAVSSALGKWLVFTDDDCIPGSNWIKAYHDAITRNDGISVFEGKTIADRPQERFDEEAPVNETGGCLWSCNFCISKSLFNSIGGFNEQLKFAMEDVDLHKRLSAGHLILFTKEAFVIHPWRRVNLFKGISKNIKYRKIFNQLHYSDFHTRMKYRIGRSKIFLAALYFDFRKLIKFRFKGTLYFLESSMLKFIYIFI
ncbi:glycosyltransferase family 2 protein [Polluticaenibacter yanchengensis]|uniref:Glycosyltransferase n=1 Tax=Polluticaenibacter yanchengensis TaxID=3014562 RepID=A0ABT4UH81_9BACT|nr:glycosyltransferase [Chitinophagaceae bacterium LY-5]